MVAELLHRELMEAQQALAAAEIALRDVRLHFDAALAPDALATGGRERQRFASRALLVAELRAADCRRRAHVALEAVELLRAAKSPVPALP